MRDNELSVAARRNRLSLLLRERHGSPLRKAIEARLADRDIDAPASAWADLDTTDKLTRSYSAHLERHRTSGSALMETFSDPRDLTLYLRAYIDQSDARDSWVLFCDPDVPALRCRMSVALTDAASFVEADKELIRILDRAARRGLMVDRIVHNDGAVVYEVTIWGSDWPENPEL